MKLRIAVLGVAAVALPLAMAAAASAFMFRDIKAAQLDAVRTTTEALSHHAQSTFRAQELTLAAAAEILEGRSWPAVQQMGGVRERLARLLIDRRDMGSVFVTSADGRQSISTTGPSGSLADRDYFRGARDNPADRLYIGAPLTGRLTGEYLFNMARARRGSDGGFGGVIAVSVRTRYFEEVYAEIAAAHADVIGLVRADGLVLARYPAVREPMVLPPGLGFMSAIGAAPVSGSFERLSQLEGIPRMYAYHRVGDYPVYVSVARSRAAVWAEWRARSLPYFLVAALASVLLSLAVWQAWQRHRSQVAALEQLAKESGRRAAAEAEKRDLQQESRSKDAFLAGLSHELRNPIGAVSLAADALAAALGGRSSPEGVEARALQIMRNQMRHLRRLLDDMLDLAAVIHGRIELRLASVQVQAWLEEFARGYAPLDGRPLQLRVRGESAWVRADGARLQQVFGNLLDNAAKYGAGQVTLTVTRPDGQVQVRVEDDGEGIDPQVLPTLFEPFVRGPDSAGKPGLGLGLALVSRLLELHGGSLRGSSAGPGHGATFTVCLPAAAAPAAGAAEVAALPGAARGAGRCVLVVDDQADARDSLAILLRLQGYEALAAASGAEALALMESATPDAVFCDIGMPGMNGYEFARTVRSRPQWRGLRLIALSGYGTPADQARAHTAGFSLHLTKPAAPEDIGRALAA